MLALFLIEGDDVNIYLITDGDDLGGLVDAAPAQLGDVDHTINAADIDRMRRSWSGT